MKKMSITAAAALALLSAAAQAGDPPEQGEQTEKWLRLQRTNNATLGAERPMPGEIAEQVYQRYLKSFTQPVPEVFERKRFVEQQ